MHYTTAAGELWQAVRDIPSLEMVKIKAMALKLQLDLNLMIEDIKVNIALADFTPRDYKPPRYTYCYITYVIYITYITKVCLKVCSDQSVALRCTYFMKCFVVCVFTLVPFKQVPLRWRQHHAGDRRPGPALLGMFFDHSCYVFNVFFTNICYLMLLKS